MQTISAAERLPSRGRGNQPEGLVQLIPTKEHVDCDSNFHGISSGPVPYAETSCNGGRSKGVMRHWEMDNGYSCSLPFLDAWRDVGAWQDLCVFRYYRLQVFRSQA